MYFIVAMCYFMNTNISQLQWVLVVEVIPKGRLFIQRLDSYEEEGSSYQRQN